MQKTKVLLFLFMLITCTGAFADESPHPAENIAPESLTSDGLNTHEYGSLYLIEQKNREILPWKVGANYSFDSGNPYLQVHGLTLTAERSLSRFHWIGVQFTKLLTTETHLTRVLNTELSDNAWGKTINTPNSSLYGIWTLIPLSGHMNFFNSHVMEAELGFRFGLGRIAYAEDSSRLGLLWSIRPMVHLTAHINMQLGIGQEIESPLNKHDSIARLKGEFGIGYQF